MNKKSRHEPTATKDEGLGLMTATILNRLQAIAEGKKHAQFPKIAGTNLSMLLLKAILKGEQVPPWKQFELGTQLFILMIHPTEEQARDWKIDEIFMPFVAAEQQKLVDKIDLVLKQKQEYADRLKAKGNLH